MTSVFRSTVIEGIRTVFFFSQILKRKKVRIQTLTNLKKNLAL